MTHSDQHLRASILFQLYLAGPLATPQIDKAVTGGQAHPGFLRQVKILESEGLVRRATDAVAPIVWEVVRES